jgi:hypothetical protein
MNKLKQVFYFPIPFLDLKNYTLNYDIINLINNNLIKKYKIIPIDLYNNILTVGMVNPSEEKIEQLNNEVDYFVTVFKIDERFYQAWIEQYGLLKIHFKKGE